MKMYLISDNAPAFIGFRLAGADGILVNSPGEARERLIEVLTDAGVGLIMLTEGLARELSDIVDDVRINRPLPLIVEIPGPEGTERGPDFIESYIKEAIGVKL